MANGGQIGDRSPCTPTRKHLARGGGKRAVAGFPQMGNPQNGWFIMEHPVKNMLKMDDLGVPVPPFQETSIWRCVPMIFLWGYCAIFWAVFLLMCEEHQHQEKQKITLQHRFVAKICAIQMDADSGTLNGGTCCHSKEKKYKENVYCIHMHVHNCVQCIDAAYFRGMRILE